jgi:hypothetical protein
VLKWFLAVAEVPGADHAALVDAAIGGSGASSPTQRASRQLRVFDQLS